MKNSELKNKVIDWLEFRFSESKTRPQKFTPSEIADATGGKYAAVGMVAHDVEDELRARGRNVFYKKIGTKRYFELV